MNKIKKYPKSVIILHWLTVVLLAIEFFVGFTMEDYEFNAENFNRYRVHALLGMFIMIITIFRIINKKKHEKNNNLPDEIQYYGNGHKTLVKTVEKLMCLLLILAPISGFIMVYQTGALQYDLGGAFPEGAKFDETMELIHKILVFLLGGLIILHIGGVILYKIKTGKNLLKRICLLIK